LMSPELWFHLEHGDNNAFRSLVSYHNILCGSALKVKTPQNK